MFSIKMRNCRICINPILALLEVVIIFILLQAIPSIAGLNLNFIDYVIISCLVLVLILISLLAHEYSHLLAAQWMHLPVQSITVSLFGATTTMNDEPSSPGEAFFLYLAGPLMNILMGVVFYAGHFIGGGDIFVAVCFFMAIFNGIFSAYNLLPVMPLDGGFMMRSVIWRISGDWLWSTRISCTIGTGISLLFLATGVVSMITLHPVICISFLIAGSSLMHNTKPACQQIYAAKVLGFMQRAHEADEWRKAA